MKKVKLLAKYCSIARPMGTDRSMSDSPIPDTGCTTFPDFFSPGPPGGESRNHSSQNTAHSNPIPPRIQNDVRHCHRVSIHASKGKDTAPPNLEPEKRIPLARPRSPKGSQLQIARAPPGYAPATLTPNNNRIVTSDARFQAAPVSAVIALHSVTTAAITSRGPNRSASQPEGICASA